MSINLEDAGEDIEPVILMRKYEDIKDYKMHVECYRLSQTELQIMKEEGSVRSFKMLEAGKGMYDTRIMKVKLSPDYNGGPLGVGDSLTMDVVQMNLGKCQWFLPVKLDAYCLGDVMREIKTVIDFGMKNWATGIGDEMPFMEVEMAPARFKDKAKGHAWVGIGKISMHHFSTLVLKLAHKDSGFGDLRFLGVDDTNDSQMRPYPAPADHLRRPRRRRSSSRRGTSRGHLFFRLPRKGFSPRSRPMASQASHHEAASST